MKTAEQLAALQLTHYNNHDLENFLAVYTDDVEVYDLETGVMRYKGKDIMRERYAGRFAEGTVHAALVNRMIIGNKAIDHEHVTGIPGKDMVEAVAIYLTKGDLIEKVWFLHE